MAERLGDLKAKTYAMNGILHASVFLAEDSLENMERMGAECIALSRRLGDNSALNYAYWNVALNYAFRGLMREAREWTLKLLDDGHRGEWHPYLITPCREAEPRVGVVMPMVFELTTSQMSDFRH